MIIDTHAHYNHGLFQNTLRYLTLENGSYGLKEGDREQLLQELLEADILCSVEPGIHLQSCEEIMALAGAYPGRIFPAMGVHPTRAIHEKWRDRKRLAQLTAREGVVANGGMVAKKRYRLTDPQLAGYGRPAYRETAE